MQSGSTRDIRPPVRAGTARATRNPRLFFEFVGVFLLRFAERQLVALLFQLPPRFTRFWPMDCTQYPP